MADSTARQADQKVTVVTLIITTTIVVVAIVNVIACSIYVVVICAKYNVTVWHVALLTCIVLCGRSVYKKTKYVITGDYWDKISY